MNVVELSLELLGIYDRNKNDSIFFDKQVGDYRAYVTDHKIGIYNTSTLRDIIVIYECSRDWLESPNTRITLSLTRPPLLEVYRNLSDDVDVTYLCDMGNYLDKITLETRKIKSFDEEYIFQMNTLYNFGTVDMYERLSKYGPILAKICYMSNSLIYASFEQNFDNMEIPEGLLK